MRKFGLIGFPLGHSFSKQYFTDKFFGERISDCSYENFELENLELFPDLIKRDHEISGLNVTIPYKTEILKYLDITDDEAGEIGAVNVLKISKKESSRLIKGFNTDIYGFRESIAPYLKGRNIKDAIVLGSGGSSKAVIHVLNGLGFQVTKVSRRSGEGIISYNELTGKFLAKNKLIINTTPVGMFPNISDKPDIGYNYLTSDHILYDLVYNPVLTVFLKKGEEQGCTILNGLKMLQLQAEKSWEIWNNKDL
jgi:shikimate dehydrogenase